MPDPVAARLAGVFTGRVLRDIFSGTAPDRGPFSQEVRHMGHREQAGSLPSLRLLAGFVSAP